MYICKWNYADGKAKKTNKKPGKVYQRQTRRLETGFINSLAGKAQEEIGLLQKLEAKEGLLFIGKGDYYWGGTREETL